MIDFNKVKKILKIKIKDKNLWQIALTHKSWLFYHPETKMQDNERLEFLGDAILSAITSLYLFKKFTYLKEGEMTLIRSRLVSRERLGEIGEKIGLEKIILMGKIEDKKGKKTVLGNTLEAIIGAIFLDLGWDETKKFVEEIVLKPAEKIIKEKSYKDPKSYLQEILLQKYHKLPAYKLVEVIGPSHKQRFKVEVYLDNQKIGEGEGTSKQEAEINAAKKILVELKI